MFEEYFSFVKVRLVVIMVKEVLIQVIFDEPILANVVKVMLMELVMSIELALIVKLAKE